MGLIEKAINSMISRRAFLKTAAGAALGTAVAIAVPGYGLLKVESSEAATLVQIGRAHV